MSSYENDEKPVLDILLFISYKKLNIPEELLDDSFHPKNLLPESINEKVHIDFKIVYIEEEPELADKYNVIAIPSLLINHTTHFVGIKDFESLKEAIKKAVENYVKHVITTFS